MSRPSLNNGQQAILDRVARELRVPEDEASRGLQPRDGRMDELGEGVMIASSRTLHEPSLVHGPSLSGRS